MRTRHPSKKEFSNQVEVKGKVIVDDPQDVLYCKVRILTNFWTRPLVQWQQMQ